MEFLFDSRDIKYKTPFGALRENSGVRFTFPVKADKYVCDIFLILKKYTGDIAKIPLYYEGGNENEKNGIFTFSAELYLAETGIYYYRFEVITEAGVISVGKEKPGGKGSGGAAEAGSESDWQLTVYGGYPEKPHELKGGVIYHIFADRFCKKDNALFDSASAKVLVDNRGDENSKGLEAPRNFIQVPPKGAVRIAKSWQELPTAADPDGVFRANDFYGGNIKGIISRLEYLASLGVSLIYLSPIFESASNHRYDTGDYFKIDGLFGTEEEFKELIKAAEKYGIGIMLDCVFNHTGADSKYFNKFGHYETLGAYQSKESPYHRWFHFSDFPDIYDCWWGVTVVPTLNKNCPKVRRLIRDVLTKWLPLGVKGVRLDVADELPKDYIYDIRKVVKTISPECYLLGEVWEDASTKVSYGTMRPYLLGAQLDSVMNYPFKDAILAYAKSGDILFLKDTVNSILENYPPYAIDLLMNVIDTHDTVRAAYYFLDDKYSALSKAEKRELDIPKKELEKAFRKLRIAALLQFTLPGIPSVYYGDEAGLGGFEDPLNRAPYPYGREDKELLEFYKRLGQFRKAYKEGFAMVGFREPGEREISGTKSIRKANVMQGGLLDYTLAGGKAEVVINNTSKALKYTFDKDCKDYFTGQKYKDKEIKTLKPEEYLLLILPDKNK